MEGRPALDADTSITRKDVRNGCRGIELVLDPLQLGPATAIILGTRVFLVDAGAGVTRQLAAAGFPRIKEVEATFLTHLRSDHTLGYPDLRPPGVAP